MTIHRFTWLLLAALLPATDTPGQNIVTNRLRLSARAGFNISARFKGSASALALPTTARRTPTGDRYNYDDGYVLTDSSGNYGGQTWYWGYDSSASQISGDTILMSRSTPSGEFTSPSFDDDPSWGAELAYNRWLGQWRKVSYGLETAVNWQSLSFLNSSTFSGYATRITDAYPFTPGTTPPATTPNRPYQGNYGDEGFLIGDTPIRSTSSLIPGGAAIAGRRRYEADLWGFRLGPYVSVPLMERLHLGLSGGFALGVLDGEASWSDTITLAGNRVSSAGHGSDLGVLTGAFAGLNITWYFHRKWNVTAGVQYQHLESYEADFGDRTVGVNLRDSYFALLGLGYRF